MLYFVVLLRAYRRADLTVVYPLARGLVPLLSSLVAIVFLGESISAFGAAGIAGVVGGVFLIAVGSASGGGLVIRLRGSWCVRGCSMACSPAP